MQNPLRLFIVLLMLPACVRQTAVPTGVYMHGPSTEKRIALTFDDGPLEPYTSEILDILKKEHVHATFFVCGIAVQRSPESVRRAALEGHEIGNHTWSHRTVSGLSDVALRGEIQQSEIAIEAATGRRPHLFRPPRLLLDRHAQSVLTELGYAIILRSWSAIDWKNYPVEKIVRFAVDGATPGGILLMHDGLDCRPNADRRRTVQALPEVIRELKSKGYTFVTVSELLKLNRDSRRTAQNRVVSQSTH